jgi:hypothetical protein
VVCWGGDLAEGAVESIHPRTGEGRLIHEVQRVAARLEHHAAIAAAAAIFDVAGITAVFNGPSYVPLAPGSVISIFGDRLAESTAQPPGFPLPNQLVTTQVTMAGVKLPLYYVSQAQVNAVVPFALNPNAPQYLLVQRPHLFSARAGQRRAGTAFPVSGDHGLSRQRRHPVPGDRRWCCTARASAP